MHIPRLVMKTLFLNHAYFPIFVTFANVNGNGWLKLESKQFSRLWAFMKVYNSIFGEIKLYHLKLLASTSQTKDIVIGLVLWSKVSPQKR